MNLREDAKARWLDFLNSPGQKDSGLFIKKLYIHRDAIRTVINQALQEYRRDHEDTMLMIPHEPEVDFIQKDGVSHLIAVHFNVAGPYFDSRQGISFYDKQHMFDGVSIEMAGWTDSENIKPFYKALLEIINYLSREHKIDYTYAIIPIPVEEEEDDDAEDYLY